jgi:hypothetical protein
MLGGARIVRVVVLHESKITANATAPPAPHNKLSRLPWIHRVSLEHNTNREYAQKQKKITKHFFSAFSYTPVTILNKNSSKKPKQFVGPHIHLGVRPKIKRIVA